MAVRVAETADVHEDAEIGEGTTIWHLAQIRERAQLGSNCTIGRGAYIGSSVRIGSNVKIQNYALVYEPASVEDGAFIGPAAILTNDTYPRSVTPSGEPKDCNDWTPVGVTVAQGASIGARAVCVAPVRIGAWALVAAGAVVTHDVPDFALVVGTPAKHARWIGRSGQPLVQSGPANWQCPATGETYTELAGVLTPDITDEDVKR